jgi:IS605 OrfB family transposase
VSSASNSKKTRGPSASRVFTYQARPTLPEEVARALDAYAEMYGRAERRLFAALATKTTENARSINDLKREFIAQCGLTARQFNALRVGLEGKISSIKERRPDLIAEMAQRIARAQRVIARIEQQASDLKEAAAALKAGRKVKLVDAAARKAALHSCSFKLHQKKRRLANLECRREALLAEHESGVVGIAFGSRRLFRAQFDLAANGYASREDWLEDWRAARSSQFMVLGSKDETAGCQGCVASVQDDGSLTLQLRLPNALIARDSLDPQAKPVRHVAITGLRFAYGHEQILAALGRSERIERVSPDGKKTVGRTGSALTYRFVRDGPGPKGWRVFVSVERQAEPCKSDRRAGAVGVDINADHLAVSELDRHGNWLDSARLDLPTYGATTEQAKAMTGEVAKLIAEKAADARKPVVMEDLDFRFKKSELERAEPRKARMLSSLAYGAVKEALRSACFKAGVELIEVNPAFTSTIGAVNHAQRLGISVHQGAAMAIARRALALSEKPAPGAKRSAQVYDPESRKPPPSKRKTKVAKPEAPKASPGLATAPARDGGHVTFALPARNGAKHVWTQWSATRKVLGAAHAARSRSGEPAPLLPASCANRELSARFRHASRQQHCSAGATTLFGSRADLRRGERKLVGS